MLEEYVLHFETLYSVQHMSANAHSLLLLPLADKNLGPLWNVSL